MFAWKQTLLNNNRIIIYKLHGIDASVCSAVMVSQRNKINICILVLNLFMWEHVYFQLNLLIYICEWRYLFLLNTFTNEIEEITDFTVEFNYFHYFILFGCVIHYSLKNPSKIRNDILLNQFKHLNMERELLCRLFSSPC